MNSLSWLQSVVASVSDPSNSFAEVSCIRTSFLIFWAFFFRLFFDIGCTFRLSSNVRYELAGYVGPSWVLKFGFVCFSSISLAESEDVTSQSFPNSSTFSGSVHPPDPSIFHLLSKYPWVLSETSFFSLLLILLIQIISNLVLLLLSYIVDKQTKP